MTPLFFGPFGILILVVTMVMAFYAQHKVSSTYEKYSKVRARSGISGREAAAYVMRAAGVDDVEIVQVRGFLSDHYDPRHKRLALSEPNYNGTHLAALGVAAHEAGHAIQHKVGYSAMKARMAMVPVTMFASQLLPFVILGGLFFRVTGLIDLGILIYLILTIFQLVTLPVEFDASKRAREQLAGLGIIDQQESVGVVRTLNAAGLTYVAAFVSTLLNLVYLILLRRE